jgi:hypothetical protein
VPTDRYFLHIRVHLGNKEARILEISQAILDNLSSITLPSIVKGILYVTKIKTLLCNGYFQLLVLLSYYRHRVLITSHTLGLVTANKNNKSKAIPVNRPWRPMELWDVEDTTLPRQSANRWRWNYHLYAPAALRSLDFFFFFLRFWY